jgi:hypothetical protein
MTDSTLAILVAIMAIIAMALAGVNVIPAVIIIPSILIVSILYSLLLVRNVYENYPE